MVPLRLQSGSEVRTLANELRSMGIVWLVCDGRGGILQPPLAGPADFVALLFHRTRTFHQLLRTLVPGLMADRTGSIAEPLPGLYVVPSRLPGRRERSMGIAIVPTAAFAYGDDLLRMAQGAGLDAVLLREMILAGDPPDGREVARLATLVRFAHLADAERQSEEVASDAVGQQLAESYEEINLLYTLVSGMAVTGEPLSFLTLACEELVRRLGFTWVAVRLRPPLDRMVPHDGLVLAGNAPLSRDGVRELATRMLLTSGGEAPRVFGRGHAATCDLGIDDPIAVCPIRRDGRSIGVLVSGERHDRGGEITSAELKLADATAGHLGIYLENTSLFRDLDAMFLGTLEAMVAAIDAKDPYTRGHSQRVAALSRELARAIQIPEPTVKQIHIAGLVHDVGKIGVPEAVLRKPGKLDEAEFAQIRMHPEIGWRILKDIPQFQGMLDGVLSHHERWDGRGYPRGLKGQEIPLIARIIALADSFDAMSSNRTYRSKRPIAQVLEEIRRCAGSQFDPELVPAFVSLDFREYERLRTEHESLSSPPTGDELEARQAA